MLPTPNLLDRMIAKVAPGVALDRLRARAAFDQYAAFSGNGSDGGARSPLNTRWSTRPQSADADQLRALPRQRAESRELRATHPIAAGAIQTNVNRVVGTGLVPIPEPDAAFLGWTDDQAAAWKSTVLREFSLWSDSAAACDQREAQTFFAWQAAVLSARLESGDCFTLLPDAASSTWDRPYRLRLQLLEADRCGNPAGIMDGETPAGDHIAAGIRRAAATGAPLQAHIYDRHPGAVSAFSRGNRQAGEWVAFTGRSGRRRVLHHYRPTRPEQSRGVPYLAPVIQAIKDLGRYTEAEISAAVISAFYTVFIKQGPAAPASPVHGTAPMEPTANAAPGPEYALGAGAVLGLMPGEDVVFADPKRPNTAYEPFTFGVLKLIAVGLHMPVELLLKRFDSSYSASRAALLDAWQHFRSERAWLVLSACQPVWETWMAEAVALGRIAAPGFFESALHRWAYTRAVWHGDSQGSLNPKDEVAAYTSAIDARLMTLERAEWELFGTDWHRSFGAKVREQQMLRDANITAVPRAGAAAPLREPDVTKPSAETQAMSAAMQAQSGAMAAQAAALQAQATQRLPEVHVNVEPPSIESHTHIDVQPPDVSITAPIHLSPTLDLHAEIGGATINVAAPTLTIEPAPVAIQPAAPYTSEQMIERDADGEIARISTRHIPAVIEPTVRA